MCPKKLSRRHLLQSAQESMFFNKKQNKKSVEYVGTSIKKFPNQVQ